MDVITTERLLTLIGFLSVLFLAWGVVRFMTARPASASAPATPALAVVGVKALGGGCQAMLLQVADHQVLVVTQHKAAPSLLHLPATTVAGQVS